MITKRTNIAILAICFFIFCAGMGCNKEIGPQTKSKRVDISFFKKGDIVDGRSIKIIDGDTITFAFGKDKKRRLKVRLWGIDTPEISRGKKSGQPFGRRSSLALKNKIHRQDIKLLIHGRDRYKRVLGEIFLQKANINLWMVEMGFAEVYRSQRCKKTGDRTLKQYCRAQQSAKKEKKGIWKLEKYISPAKFRRQNRGH